MRVVAIETFAVAPRWLFLRVETDEGIVGWGEPVLEGHAEIIETAVHALAEHLIDSDPLLIEDHWQVMTKSGFYRGGPVFSSAVAGIDQALWDIAGKARGVPVHELIGGPVREAVRVYAWIGGDEPSEVSEHAMARIAEGFTALKMNIAGRLSPFASQSELRSIVARVCAVREAIGPDPDLAVDFHGRVSVPMARRLISELEDLNLLFVEEPVPPEHLGALASLVDTTRTPLACGERLYSRWEFEPVLRAGIAVAQPDVSHAGGISEVRRIGAQAELHGALLAPHCPLGPIALAASMQLDVATPNFLIQEQSFGMHYGPNGLVHYLVDASVFDREGGRVPRLTKPGLGIEIDEGEVRKASETGHKWRTPLWRHEDGSLADW
ncbi:MAG: galactonate dehydratase [Acidimicrobiales bacterium]|jgi:galactonate dehydratase